MSRHSNSFSRTISAHTCRSGWSVTISSGNSRGPSGRKCSTKVGGPEAELIGRIQELGVPAVLVVNKIDTVKKDEELFSL